MVTSTMSVVSLQPSLNPDMHHNDTVSKKTVQNYFCQNFIKFPPTVKFLGTKIAERINLCEVYSFSTSPNLCECTTVLNADVPNCYIMLQFLDCTMQ